MNPRLMVAVAAAKTSALLNAWTNDDLEDPVKGIARHFNELKGLDALWGMSSVMSKIDTGPDFEETYNAHKAWGISLAELYQYFLKTSKHRLPSALRACGHQLILDRELMEKEHLEEEIVTKLKDRAISLMMDINLGEFKLTDPNEDTREKEAAKKAYTLLEKMYCSTPVEEAWKTEELNRIAGIIEGDVDRSEWPKMYLDQLDLYVQYLMKVEKHLAESV